MRTILINTSREAKNTGLDILFKAPFDHRSFICYDKKLCELDSVTVDLENDLVKKTDFSDKSYNLIFIVDLNDFPRSNEIEILELYKALITRYICISVVKKTYKLKSLCPKGVSVYFLAPDASPVVADLDYDNYLQQEKEEYKKVSAKDEKRENRAEASEDGYLSDDDISDSVLQKEEEFNFEEKLWMYLFGWDKDVTKETLNWKLKCSSTDEIYLDFSEAFYDTIDFIKKSDESISVINIALNSKKIALKGKLLQEYSGCLSYDEVFDNTKKCSFNVISAEIKRENEQEIMEGFFEMYANIFSCVSKGTLVCSYREYTTAEIKKILDKTLEKYMILSKSENLVIDVNDIRKVEDLMEPIVKSWKEKCGVSAALEKNKSKNSSNSKKTEDESKKEDNIKNPIKKKKLKIYKIDQEFNTLAQGILKAYDPQKVDEENSKFVEKNYKKLWSRRDENTEDEFSNLVKARINSSSKNESKDIKENKDNSQVYKKLEKKREEFILSVADAERNLVVDRTVSKKVKEISAEYSALKQTSFWAQKGVWARIALYELIVSVLIMVIPYDQIEKYSGNAWEIHNGIVLWMLGIFTILYFVAIGIHESILLLRKNKSYYALEEIKVKLDENKIKSEAALKEYCENIVVEAEAYTLLENEIRRMEAENAKKFSMKNAHKKRLEQLIEVVRNLKRRMNLGEIEPKVNSKDEESTEYFLNAEESFYSENNKKQYSIITDEE